MLFVTGAFTAYRITVINQRSAADAVSQCEVVQLNNKQPAFGWPRLLPLARLTDPAAGFLVGDRLRLKVELAC